MRKFLKPVQSFGQAIVYHNIGYNLSPVLPYRLPELISNDAYGLQVYGRTFVTHFVYSVAIIAALWVAEEEGSLK